MYISEVQSGQKLRKRRFYSPYLGEIEGSILGETGLDVARAVSRNRYYAQQLGWGLQFDRIAGMLGFRNRSPDETSFARAVARWQASRPGLSVDGIIGPNTWRVMRPFVTPGQTTPASPAPQAASARSSVTGSGSFTLLPTPGAGYRSYSGPGRQHGRAQTIQALQAIGRAWMASHPNGPRIQIGDISFADGSFMSPHRSHRNGLDVDIRPIRNDSREDRVTIQSAEYSQMLTQELVDSIHANGVLPVRVILFNDPKVRGVRPWPGHDNHLHVSFQLPAASRGR